MELVEGVGTGLADVVEGSEVEAGAGVVVASVVVEAGPGLGVAKGFGGIIVVVGGAPPAGQQAGFWAGQGAAPSATL